MPTLLTDLWKDLHDLRMLWQLAVVAVGLGLAWRAGRQLRGGSGSPDETGRFALGGLQRLQFPLTALIVVLIGRAVLERWQPVGLLNVAVPLLTALAVIRVVLYVLRRVFVPSGWLRAFERYIAWGVWIGVALYITGLAPHLIDFLDGVAITAGSNRISLLTMLSATLAILATILAALWLGRTIESRLMQATQLHMSLRVMLSKLSQALLVLIAVLIALPAVGVDPTVLSVFGGAIGVGLGFGLQKIASNYVSGFIILMDRSVGIGDVITVDRYSGELVKMTARYVVVRAADGSETLIPNETLVTTPVVNHSYTDRRVRVAVPVPVDYRSDAHLALRLLQEAGARHRHALREPAPDVQIKQFGENGLQLELGVWVDDPRLGTSLRADLNAAIWDAFKANGIRMPPPRYAATHPQGESDGPKAGFPDAPGAQ